MDIKYLPKPLTDIFKYKLYMFLKTPLFPKSKNYPFLDTFKLSVQRSGKTRRSYVVERTIN